LKNILAEYTDGGVHYSFRYAEKEDKKKIIKFYESMDSESIYFRFLSYFKDFSSHVEKIFGEKNKLGFAIIGEDESNRIAGLGETYSYNIEGAELAFIVDPRHRKRGLGTIIAAMLILGSYKRGIKNMEAFFHAENGPAYRIGLRMGLRMEFDEDVYHGKAPLNEIYTIALNNLKEKNVSLYYERI
jgi:RimJ/RimL family protein N-acetyltransferase